MIWECKRTSSGRVALALMFFGSLEKTRSLGLSLKFKLMQSFFVFCFCSKGINHFMLVREILFLFVTGSNCLKDLFSRFSKDTFAQQEWWIWIGLGSNSCPERNILIIENQLVKFLSKTSYLNPVVMMIRSWHKTSFTCSFEN